MAKKNKIIHLNNLSSFWNKAEAWITTNFQSLFENDESQEEAINGISERLDALSPCDNAKIDDLFNEHPEMVDLGLPSGLLWAKWNIGAKQETDYGLFFKWGETEGHTSDELEHFDKTTPDVEYDSQKRVLLPKYDAATVAYGMSYRMPTGYDARELMNNTTHALETINGVYGMSLRSKTDPSKYIFVPYAGDIFNSSHRYVASAGFLLTSYLGAYGDPEKLDCNNLGHVYVNEGSKNIGLSIRAVKQP